MRQEWGGAAAGRRARHEPTRRPSRARPPAARTRRTAAAALARRHRAQTPPPPPPHSPPPTPPPPDRQRRPGPAAIARNPAYPFGELALSEYLRRWAALQPQKAAVIFYGQTITYAQLDALSERCAALLARHGVQAGERVAVMLPNCPQYHIVFFAILKLGAVHVPVNPLFKAQELLYELNDSGAKTLVVLDQLAEMAGRVLPRTS